MRIASATALEKMSSALTGSLNFGLEVFVPEVRLLPGQPLPQAALPDHGRSTLLIVSDEGPDMRLSTKFLESTGVRVRWEKDFSHRYDNTHKCAVADANFDGVLTKILFLSRVNHGPWGSGKNTNLKSELFQQLAQITKSDESILKSAQSDFLFDQQTTDMFSDCVYDEMLGGAKSIFEQTEGMEGKRFFSFVKQWSDVDRNWTLEFLNLDIYYKGQAKVNPEVPASFLVHCGKF